MQLRRFALTIAGVLAFAAAPLSTAADTMAIPAAAGKPDAFAATRARFHTKVHLISDDHTPSSPAPKDIFSFVHFPAAPGPLGGFLTPDPQDGKRHPAIIWITGGDCNSVGGDGLVVKSPRTNDQSAAAYRKAGIVMFFPSLRGGNANPGQREGFFGEIDDVLAAADYLSQQPYVDPDRIYLGGHSTGGTLVLLTAEASSRFRAVFAFGPVADATVYGQDLLPVDFTKLDPMETMLRLPGYWLPSVKKRLIVIEGSSGGNVDHLEYMRKRSTNPNISFVAVNGATHFSVLAPANEVLAQKILQDTGPTANIQVSEAELRAALQRR